MATGMVGADLALAIVEKDLRAESRQKWLTNLARVMGIWMPNWRQNEMDLKRPDRLDLGQ
jgi:hypothetical protein